MGPGAKWRQKDEALRQTTVDDGEIEFIALYCFHVLLLVLDSAVSSKINMIVSWNWGGECLLRGGR